MDYRTITNVKELLKRQADCLHVPAEPAREDKEIITVCHKCGKVLKRYTIPSYRSEEG